MEKLTSEEREKLDAINRAAEHCKTTMAQYINLYMASYVENIDVRLGAKIKYLEHEIKQRDEYIKKLKNEDDYYDAWQKADKERERLVKKTNEALYQEHVLRDPKLLFYAMALSEDNHADQKPELEARVPTAKSARRGRRAA